MEIKERPILFSAPMVKAILEGRKTQTRRVVKPQPTGDDPIYNPSSYEPDRGFYFKGGGKYKCPYDKPGDRLWVRETWCNHWPIGTAKSCIDGPCYRATDDGECIPEQKWKPSIHMPRWASRINLEIIDIRVERVQDISHQDAQAEGCTTPSTEMGLTQGDWRGSFHALWDSINGKTFPWSDNPWVWVVEFKRLEATH